MDAALVTALGDVVQQLRLRQRFAARECHAAAGLREEHAVLLDLAEQVVDRRLAPHDVFRPRVADLCTVKALLTCRAVDARIALPVGVDGPGGTFVPADHAPDAAVLRLHDLLPERLGFRVGAPLA